MPPITIKEAADSTGKSKSSILRAIQSGRISAQRDDLGQWLIDPSELYRVYEPAPEGGADDESVHRTTAPHHTSANESPQDVEIRLLREMLVERDRERDRLVVEHNLRIANLETNNEGLENVISDLMARLDQEAADRRRAYAQLTNLLTDQRAPAERGQQVVPNRWWWPW
ncbi:conserved hypothetical protein [Gammaproteobacteria bacterium]